jgi:hypothetical protein
MRIMKKKVINNLARRLQKKYPRLYSSMGTKRVKRVLSGVFGEKIFIRNHSNHFSATASNFR